MEYKVFNYTDGIYASDKIFNSKKSAEKFIYEFRNRYEQQGYYRDNNCNKISPKDIDLMIVSKNFKIYPKI